MSQRLTARFQRFSEGTSSDVDPDLDGANYEITLEVKADGAGAGGAAITAHSKANTSWQNQRKATGHFWHDVASLTDGTWYEAWWTWIRGGASRQGYRRLYYRETVTGPTAPTISAVSDGDGDGVTVTIAGVVGVSYQVFAQSQGSGEEMEAAGTPRTGSGDVSLIGLEDNTWYAFLALGESEDSYGEPSNVVRVYVSSGTLHQARYRVVGIRRGSSSQTKTLVLERVKRPVVPVTQEA